MPTISGPVGFGEFELDLETGELRRSGTILKLRPQSASVLCLLVSQAGKLVTRKEIRRLLWGDSTFVDYDAGVDHCVNRIRSILCDRGHAPRYVETVPRRGYRFIAPVRRQRLFAEPTLAVLPFANLNGDPARDYFADGMTDALITELARIPAVRVISRQSVLHLKGSNRKLEEIAHDLAVDGVVEGAALHEGDRVRLTVQLILVGPERHMWAQSYECDMSAVLSTQREAAQAIAACVAAALRPGGGVAPASVPLRPAAPGIVEDYLKAIAELHKGSAESMGKALQGFRELTVKAPDFAPGLAGHAACLFSLGWFGHAPAREVYPSAKQMALQAVATDDSVSGGHQVLATMNWILDWDLAAAEREFRRAVELSPSDPDARSLYAIFLSGAARYSESIVEAQYGAKLNPTSLFQNQAAAWIYLHACQYASAEAQARRTLESFPDALQPHYVLGWALWRQGGAEEAVAVFERALGLSREASSLSFLGHVYGRLGRADEAKRLLRELDLFFTQGRASPIAFVVIYAGLGDADAAFGWLETAYRLRSDMIWLTLGFPGIDPLRSDPRFADLVRRMRIVMP
jgi:TolB-like protein/Tfp pilus assembly protein PilF